jgi:flap endonuclease-1
MGIRYLNKFFKEHAPNAIKYINLGELSGKKVAIDVSIYMYKYAAEGTLIENMYLMLAVFKHYNIVPIFIFDGKPPAEKKELLQKRREDKKSAEEQYNSLRALLENNINMDEAEKQDIIANMDILKRTFIYISKTDIETVKQLIRAYGATYYDAPGEADELCALLSIKGKVWACLSEDMDMFVYGCPRVIRYLSLLKHTAVLYDMNGILEQLNITQTHLREICILSGNDYNSEVGGQSLYDNMKYFRKYQDEKNSIEFCDWLRSQQNYTLDMNKLLRINDMFDLSYTPCNIKKFEKIKILNCTLHKKDLNAILRSDGFILRDT